MLIEENIIERCRKQDPEAQKIIYDKYAPLFYSICLRYLNNRMDAEDALVEGFYKIFSKIGQYKDQGSFEGWMKRIVINECLMKIRKGNNLNMHLDITEAYGLGEDSGIISDLNYKSLISLMDELPDGYRTVFNLYVVEGYKHREIAEILGISINTSKSQLILAKKKMKELYKKKHNIKIDKDARY